MYHSHLYGTALPSMWDYKTILHEVHLGALFLHSRIPMFRGTTLWDCVPLCLVLQNKYTWSILGRDRTGDLFGVNETF